MPSICRLKLAGRRMEIDLSIRLRKEYRVRQTTLGRGRGLPAGMGISMRKIVGYSLLLFFILTCQGCSPAEMHHSSNFATPTSKGNCYRSAVTDPGRE